MVQYLLASFLCICQLFLISIVFERVDSMETMEALFQAQANKTVDTYMERLNLVLVSCALGGKAMAGGF